MTTLYITADTADRRYTKCDRCGGCTPCPESTCFWAAVLANNGGGKIYCTVPDVEPEKRVTRFGI